MLTGVLVPTAGRAAVCGLDPVRQRRELARRIGVVFGQRSQLWWDLPLRRQLRPARARSTACRPRRYRERLDECVRAAGHGRVPRTRRCGSCRSASGCAARSPRRCCTPPSLLVLDEPTIGLDLASKERLRAFLPAVNARGDVTLLLTTHDLPDVERLCRRVVVIDHGRVLVDDDARHAAATVRRQPRRSSSSWPSRRRRCSACPAWCDVAVEAQGLRQRLEFTAGDHGRRADRRRGAAGGAARRHRRRAVHRGPGAHPLRPPLTAHDSADAATPGIRPLRNASTNSAWSSRTCAA